MKIEQFKSNIFPTKFAVVKENQKAEEHPSKQSDSIEISSKGQKLSKLLENGKNLDAIREKINQGFYNSDEVLKKVADAILKEINSK